jgi:hypothetical protein
MSPILPHDYPRPPALPVRRLKASDLDETSDGLMTHVVK